MGQKRAKLFYDFFIFFFHEETITIVQKNKTWPWNIEILAQTEKGKKRLETILCHHKQCIFYHKLAKTAKEELTKT